MGSDHLERVYGHGGSSVGRVLCMWKRLFFSGKRDGRCGGAGYMEVGAAAVVTVEMTETMREACDEAEDDSKC